MNEYKAKVNPKRLELVWNPAFMFTVVEGEAKVFITKSALPLHIFVALLIIKIFNDILYFLKNLVSVV